METLYMSERMTQQEKAQLFHRLHQSDKLLILPNIWDSLGALVLENMGYPAIATASASIAFSRGFNDGEQIPFEELLVILERITTNVNLPVTADIESGFADNEKRLTENIRQVIKTGIVGINFEDTDKKTGTLYSIETQCKRINVIKHVAAEMDVPLFVNARTDVFVRGKGLDTAEAKLEEAIKRGIAYKNAGADCFFPLAVQREADIKSIVEQLKMPVNIILIPGVPSIDTLHKSGVKRISLGPGFLKIAIKAMKNLATKLQSHEGLEEIAGNEITSDYLINLVKTK
jgi:2-methylisocitrate lyase-like PEP mutase family enzyme